MLMLMCARNTYAVDRVFRTGNFDFNARHRFVGSDLQGKTLGIIGLGRIGRLVAKKAHFGFDMHVLAYSRHIGTDSIDEYIEPCLTLDSLLKRSDFVSLHLPAAPSTHGIIGARELFIMKPTAILVNTARGELVDNAALVRALKSGSIRAAGLDCYYPEPPKPDDPLLTLPNVIATSHNASHTAESLERMALHAAIGVVDVREGRIPQTGIIDKVLQIT